MNLENTVSVARPAAQRLLLLLKTRGPLPSADLGAALGITGEAARQQLLKLGEEGLVEAGSEARGVGRPLQTWRLTDAGNARFPDTHAELTVQLIATVRNVLGEAALEQIIAAREAETRDAYASALAGVGDLGERVARLAELRAREGYMAEWRDEGDSFLLIENHCPICAAATICQGFCRAELDIFRSVLGNAAQIVREEHILAGARRCVYRITPADRVSCDLACHKEE
jgi:predicted ArsR family transcriptional regulator